MPGFFSTSLTEIQVDPDNPVYKSIEGVLYSKDGSTLIEIPGSYEGAVTIPADVTSIEAGSISILNNTTEINVDTGNPAYKSIDGILYTKDGSTLVKIPVAYEKASVIIPLKTIGASSVWGCNNLRYIEIPDTVTVIEKWAFNMTSDCQITVPSSVIEIAEYVFGNSNYVLVENGSVAETYCRNTHVKYDTTFMNQDGSRAIIHDWQSSHEIPSTCMKTGIRYLRCKTCGEDSSEQIPLDSHSLEKHSRVAPTCYSEGMGEYWSCTICGKKFSDSQATHEVTAEEMVLEKTEHKWNKDYTVDRYPTATQEGLQSIYCSECWVRKPGSEVSIPKLVTVTTPEPDNNSHNSNEGSGGNTNTDTEPASGTNENSEGYPYNSYPTVQTRTTVNPVNRQTGYGTPAGTSGYFQTTSYVPKVISIPVYFTGQILDDDVTVTVLDHITIAKVPASVKAKPVKNRVTVSWKKIRKKKKTKALLKQIKGVQVQYSTDPAFTNGIIKTVGKNKTKINLKLKRKTVYYVRVRYTDGAGGYSNWSRIRTVKTK